jgi:hypothetical protein
MIDNRYYYKERAKRPEDARITKGATTRQMAERSGQEYPDTDSAMLNQKINT